MKGFIQCSKGHFFNDDLTDCPYCPNMDDDKRDETYEEEVEKEIKRLKNRRVIKTARDLDSINEAAKNGYRPLIKEVKKDPSISSKYTVWQNIVTGHAAVIGDYRGLRIKEDDWEEVIGWTTYYPHNFKSPYAAYLVPPDIVIGERVFIKDLIEDYIGEQWNQGDKWRLESCEAIWNGSEFEILYSRPSEIIG